MSITLRDCSICYQDTPIIKKISWDAGSNNWLITGSNGSGKTLLVSALAGLFDIVPHESGFYGNKAKESIQLVSFEAAAAVIEEERRLDDSDFVEGGVDDGRTPRKFIMQDIADSDRSRYPEGREIEKHPAVILCGIEQILDRGLKYLSTGEIRRTLLCRALTAKPELLILDEPYEGLDAGSRQRLKDFLETGIPETQILLVMDRPICIPASITQVLELTKLSVSYMGPRADYESIPRPISLTDTRRRLENDLLAVSERSRLTLSETMRTNAETLVEMRNVTVEWSGRKVLNNLSWTLRRGEHWLIRGPNGSGKTTFLELITGDNPQVFRNDVRLFGIKRGSGETIWELKEKMGIVSYRLHTDYRALGDLPIETVILSGLHDSIGLYQQCGDEERSLAKNWLALAGFEGRDAILFRDLSYGEQRAILIARAAIKQPPILILDEPCHGLDTGHRDRILHLLEKIAENGESTLLHVTHDETEVLPCERHILELCPGETPMYRISIKE
jgi:ABC-type molybdenum transport system, ATPase component/photorepair protein PhrA